MTETFIPYIIITVTFITLREGEHHDNQRNQNRNPASGTRHDKIRSCSRLRDFPTKRQYNHPAGHMRTETAGKLAMGLDVPVSEIIKED